jgi:hypothetical protein
VALLHRLKTGVPCHINCEVSCGVSHRGGDGRHTIEWQSNNNKRTSTQVRCRQHKKEPKITALRIEKCEAIVGTLYHHKDRAYFLPYCRYFISYHAKLEKEAMEKGDIRARGFSGTWWWSLLYGGANFSLRCYATAPGNCAGPLDVKHYPLITDPKANIRHHCKEMFGFYLQGVRGRDLCEHVMYPRRPHDWGGGRFAKTDQRHRQVLKRYYQEAKN